MQAHSLLILYVFAGPMKKQTGKNNCKQDDQRQQVTA
jgi:hypothetical protein